MDAWDNTVGSIVIGNQTYTEENWQQIPEWNMIDEEYPWSFVFIRNDKQIIVYLENEEKLVNWLTTNHYNKLAKAFKDAMKIRKLLIDNSDEDLLKNTTFMRWFCKVQTLGEDVHHGCHYLFDKTRTVPAPPNPTPPDRYVHINDGASIPNFTELEDGHWATNKKSLQVCTGTVGAILYMGAYFKLSARIFAGDKIVSKIYNIFDQFKNALSDQDLGPF